MATGTISYYALSSGLELDEIKISNANSKIQDIIIKTEYSDRISITLTLINVFSSKEAGTICEDIVNVLLDKLAIEFNIPIGEPQCSGISLPTDESGTKNVVMTSLVQAYDILEGDLKPGEERIEELVQKLSNETPPRNQHLSLYRFSVKQKDPVAKFMFLYNILLLLYNDSQKDLDAYVRRCNPNIQQSPRPDKIHIIETIYTRLRNEVAHCRSSVLPEHTSKEIADNIISFQEIVKAAVLYVA